MAVLDSYQVNSGSRRSWSASRGRPRAREFAELLSDVLGGGRGQKLVGGW